MTEAEWLECADPTLMLEFLRGKASERKLRLFAVATVWRAREFLTDEAAQRAIDSAELYADGMVDRKVLQEARLKVNLGLPDLDNAIHIVASRTFPPSFLFRYGIVPWQPTEGLYQRIAAICLSGSTFPLEATAAIEQQIARLKGGGEANVQAKLLRDIFGNPFRPVTVDSAWLTSTVVSLATAIYADRDFDRLPILADALEDAGCDNADILNHCRQPGDHVRGCWAVDLVLEKK